MRRRNSIGDPGLAYDPMNSLPSGAAGPPSARLPMPRLAPSCRDPGSPWKGRTSKGIFIQGHPDASCRV